MERPAISTVALTGEQLFQLCIAAMIAFVVVTLWTVFFLRKDGRLIEHVVRNEFLFLRILTVLFVVWSTTVLALLGALSEGVTALFGGIIGYVLGSIHRQTREAKKESEEAELSKE